MSSDRSRLDGQTTLVTGGAGFLGRRWVSALLNAGASVISVDLGGPEYPTGETIRACGTSGWTSPTRTLWRDWPTC